MIAPQKRIWLYPTDSTGLEILILGDPDEIAPMFAKIHQAIEAWPGFSRITSIVAGLAQLGIHVRMTPVATYDDPIAEAMKALSSLAVEFIGVHGGGVGLVGLWK